MFFFMEILQEVVYMQQPPRFVAKGGSHKVCLLKKSIYKLKQSPRVWFEKLRNTLVDFGFIRCGLDYSVFVKHLKRGCLILMVYVDDMVISGSDIVGIQQTR